MKQICQYVTKYSCRIFVRLTKILQIYVKKSIIFSKVFLSIDKYFQLLLFKFYIKDFQPFVYIIKLIFLKMVLEILSIPIVEFILQNFCHLAYLVLFFKCNSISK
jgi:hypothetical protein